ncbi:hypothetical protein PR048_019179 [Dryococelus australis]|uniref:Uncharacterized protein n=1 Tax=Dryococelus australis TaxID=614101 RepID=A0ABQ9H2T9_9NEOP|nr:hypothetical protein PR048_019179 [Dryococelus australis]
MNFTIIYAKFCWKSKKFVTQKHLEKHLSCILLCIRFCFMYVVINLSNFLQVKKCDLSPCVKSDVQHMSNEATNKLSAIYWVAQT